MSRVPAVVLSAPGTNRDLDVASALELAGASVDIVALTDLRDRNPLVDARLVVVAGGFSFADALGSGRLFALELAARLGEGLVQFAAAGRPVIGICNGFQTIVRAGLLPGALGHNSSGRFECRWVTLTPPASRSIWTSSLTEDIECPVAHGEGRYTCCPETLTQLRANGQIALRYAGGTNPNGSLDDIAGICDETGVVLGLMPHPENHVRRDQHPRWTRREERGLALSLFTAGVNHAREA